MEMSVMVLVVGCVVGRQWQVQWQASGQLSSVNPTTTTRPLSTPCPPSSHGDIFNGPKKTSPYSTPPVDLK